MKLPRWLWLLLLVPLVAGVLRLRFDVEVLNLLPANIPAVQGLKVYQQNFANAAELVIALEADDADLAEAAAQSLALRLRQNSHLVSRALWQAPWLEHPEQAAELMAYLWLNQPPEVFSTLTARLESGREPTLQETRERLAITFSPEDLARLTRDPFNLMELPEAGSSPGGTPPHPGGPMAGDRDMFASADGTFRLIHAQARDGLKNYGDCATWLEAIRAVVSSWRSEHAEFAPIKIGFTGTPAFTAEIAGGMERDMKVSVLFALCTVAVLFWVAHRTWRPLLWLVCLVAVILSSTLAFGGLFIGTLNVVSTGFAAILLGLAVDYGLVLYQEARSSPALSARAVRREVGSSIVWSAITTASAFFILNLSSLPGLAQLGTLVALGVVLAAVVMLYAYLPPLIKPDATAPKLSTSIARAGNGFYWTITAALVVAGGLTLSRGLPPLNASSEPLRPRYSDAYATMDHIKNRLGGEGDPSWLVISGANEQEVLERMEASATLLEGAASRNQIERFELPASLWPNPAHQTANRPAAARLEQQRDPLRQAALRAGFTAESLRLTDAMLDAWATASLSATVFWPANEGNRWILEKIAARKGNRLYALGLVYPAKPGQASRLPGERPGANDSVPPDSPAGAGAGPALLYNPSDATETLARDLEQHGAWLSSWEGLSRALLDVVRADLWKTVLPMLLLVCAMLWCAFRHWAQVALSFVTIIFSGFCLLVVMKWTGWSWNLMNLMAAPLLLGMSVDFSIHMQCSLRRHRGDSHQARRTTGRALWLCGLTTVVGFGSLGFSSNAGLASLGVVCAAGIACAMLVSVYLLPVWWAALGGARCEVGGGRDGVEPSLLYTARFWRAGLWAARRLPGSFCRTLGRCGGLAYYWLVPRRREVVIQNLLPPLHNDRAAATRASRKLFQQFGVKLVDLWRAELGLPIDDQFAGLTGWEHFLAAKQKGHGVLLVTPHLGNWEFGGPLMSRQGFKLHVVTQAEPGRGLTELRQDSRARWGVETLVIGNNPFAFVDIIKCLEAGGTVALLMDRPPSPSAVKVGLFGREFCASIAAAELARASGCAIIPVYLPRTKRGYAAHTMPEIVYDRAALGTREARRELTREIMRAFEPVIGQHLDQWYHFVPIWPEAEPARD